MKKILMTISLVLAFIAGPASAADTAEGITPDTPTHLKDFFWGINPLEAEFRVIFDSNKSEIQKNCFAIKKLIQEENFAQKPAFTEHMNALFNTDSGFSINMVIYLAQLNGKLKERTKDQIEQDVKFWTQEFFLRLIQRKPEGMTTYNYPEQTQSH